MNAVVYASRRDRVIILPEVASPEKSRLYWTSRKIKHRSRSTMLVRECVMRQAHKPKVFFTYARPSLKKSWNRTVVISSLNPWMTKLWSFTKLKPGWNSSHAPSPSMHAVLNAARFVGVMVASGQKPNRIVPSAVGGVAVTCRVKDRKVLIEFFNDGQANALFADDATESLHTEHVPTTVKAYQAAIAKMRRYLDG
jgi:hypothetical protein